MSGSGRRFCFLFFLCFLGVLTSLHIFDKVKACFPISFAGGSFQAIHPPKPHTTFRTVAHFCPLSSGWFLRRECICQLFVRKARARALVELVPMATHGSSYSTPLIMVHKNNSNKIFTVPPVPSFGHNSIPNLHRALSMAPIDATIKHQQHREVDAASEPWTGERGHKTPNHSVEQRFAGFTVA